MKFISSAVCSLCICAWVSGASEVQHVKDHLGNVYTISGLKGEGDHHTELIENITYTPDTTHESITKTQVFYNCTVRDFDTNGYVRQQKARAFVVDLDQESIHITTKDLPYGDQICLLAVTNRFQSVNSMPVLMSASAPPKPKDPNQAHLTELHFMGPPYNKPAGLALIVYVDGRNEKEESKWRKATFDMFVTIFHN
jgi:hypothetical protein